MFTSRGPPTGLPTSAWGPPDAVGRGWGAVKLSLGGGACVFAGLSALHQACLACVRHVPS